MFSLKTPKLLAQQIPREWVANDTLRPMRAILNWLSGVLSSVGIYDHSTRFETAVCSKQLKNNNTPRWKYIIINRSCMCLWFAYLNLTKTYFERNLLRVAAFFDPDVPRTLQLPQKTKRVSRPRSVLSSEDLGRTADTWLRVMGELSSDLRFNGEVLWFFKGTTQAAEVSWSFYIPLWKKQMGCLRKKEYMEKCEHPSCET